MTMEGKVDSRADKELLVLSFWSLQSVRRYRGPTDHVTQKVMAGILPNMVDNPLYDRKPEGKKKRSLSLQHKIEIEQGNSFLARAAFSPNLSPAQQTALSLNSSFT